MTMAISDPILDACRRAGERIGDIAFRDFGPDATEANLFDLERIFIHGPSDLFLDSLGASEDQRLLAKIVSGHALRTRYENLVRSAAVVRTFKSQNENFISDQPR